MVQPYLRTDPQQEAYFQSDDKKGGPTDPIMNFNEIYHIIMTDEDKAKYDEYPLFTFLKQFSAEYRSFERQGQAS